MEDLPLSRTAAVVPKFTVKDLPLGRIPWWWWWWWWRWCRETSTKKLNVLFENLMCMRYFEISSSRLFYLPQSRTYTPRDLQPKCPWIRCLKREQQSGGPQHKTDTQGWASLNMWSAQCQGHHRRQHRTTCFPPILSQSIVVYNEEMHYKLYFFNFALEYCRIQENRIGRNWLGNISCLFMLMMSIFWGKIYKLLGKIHKYS